MTLKFTESFKSWLGFKGLNSIAQIAFNAKIFGVTFFVLANFFDRGFDNWHLAPFVGDPRTGATLKMLLDYIVIYFRYKCNSLGGAGVLGEWVFNKMPIEMRLI